MTMKFRYAILGFGLLLASLSAGRQGDCAEEPCYQGRTLTSWLNDFAYGRFPDMDKHNAAVKAVREIGADAIPILMKRIKTTSEDHSLLLRSEPKRGAQKWQDHYTVSAFEALGPVAHREIPTLIDLLSPNYDAASESSTEPDYWLKYRSSELAGSVLEAMGAAGVDPLLEELTAENPKIRFGVVGVLESTYRSSKDERIVPAILKKLRDEDAQVRWISARVLGSINTLPETCVPALAERVRDDPAGNVKCYALMALMKFGPRAQAALPDVMAATSDEDDAIRYYAREAVKAIQR
jgi:hypothetical protein